MSSVIILLKAVRNLIFFSKYIGGHWIQCSNFHARASCRLQQEHELGAGGAGGAITVEGQDEPCLGQGAVPPCLVLRDARGRVEVTAGDGQGGGDVRPGGD